MPARVAFINPSISTDNVGDLFIVDSVKRILVYDASASIEIDPRKPITSEHIEQINSTSCAIITGTNLWYRRMARPGRWMFTLDDLKKIRVPIIPWGVGTTRHTGEDNGFEPDTLAQLRIIHDSCNMGSARDERTLEALNEAGIKNVAMTGCPTLFRSLSPTWKLKQKDSQQFAVTVRKGQRNNVRTLLRLARERAMEPVVAAQQEGDRFLSHALPFLRKPVPTLYQFDICPYLDLIGSSRGAIGWRLHGNMLHLAHGNPAILFSNCSRSESFCKSFGLPVVYCEDGDPLSEAQIAQMLDKLADPGTFELLPARYREHRECMARFLDANALEHRLHDDAPAMQ